ncbi:recombinase [Streptomyces sp. NPDC056237]|uniref:recombinase n=1 Tax=unclassified Streptomyces TaxID=2593676 RepID=UPI0035E3732F
MVDRTAPHRKAGIPRRLGFTAGDLILRRRRAEDEQWLGEIEGIDLTLTFVRTKQADAARLTHRSPVSLGIPTTRPPRE